MVETPNYFAIIPANVWYDKELKANEKLLYGEIVALCSKNGECWASNNYFSELYEVSNQSISTWINHLKIKGYIDVEMIYKDGSKEIDKRVIRIQENFNTYSRKVDDPYSKKLEGGIQENLKGNNTRMNNTRMNNKENIKEIIDYLNEKGKTSFTTTNKKTVALINARLNQGYTVDDFKDVIWRKYLDWVEEPYKFTNGQMSDMYFRPSTLFNETNFENYLQEYHKLADDE